MYSYTRIQVEIFSYQCSQLSTSESIIGVFNTASEFQGKQGASSVAVVVLDEVGLAEDSPNLPLKALHPLLEDGTEGAKKGYIDEVLLVELHCVCLNVIYPDQTSPRESCLYWHIKLGP